MAAASILSTGSGAAVSADFTVTGPTTIALRGSAGEKAPHDSFVMVQLKDEAGVYWDVLALAGGRQSAVLVGPGTYRAVRRGGTCGMFSG